VGSGCFPTHADDKGRGGEVGGGKGMEGEVGSKRERRVSQSGWRWGRGARKEKGSRENAIRGLGKSKGTMRGREGMGRTCGKRF